MTFPLEKDCIEDVMGFDTFDWLKLTRNLYRLFRLSVYFSIVEPVE